MKLSNKKNRDSIQQKTHTHKTKKTKKQFFFFVILKHKKQKPKTLDLFRKCKTKINGEKNKQKIYNLTN